MKSPSVPLFQVSTLSLVFAGLLCASAAQAQDVLTYHNNNARTGLNSKETILTTTNVNSSSFGKLFTLSVDGKVDAQPLYLSSVAVTGKGTHNLVIVATEHDSLYAFDADTGAQMWHTRTLKTGENPSDSRGCSQVSPEIGITSTPAINRPAGSNGTIYAVSMSKDGSANYHQRLHAIDAASGSELNNGPVEITAKYPGTGDNSSNGFVVFDPAQYKERSGIVFANGSIYLAWASHCDFRPYTGWIMAYKASNLTQTSVLNVTPNGNEGAMWGAGGGTAADGSGNLFILDGNGFFDTALNSSGFPNEGDFGNGFLKVTTAGGLAVADYFEMSNEQQENDTDTDLGSGGVFLLSVKTTTGVTKNLAIGAGKDSNIYVVDRTSMGKFNAGDSKIYQEIDGVLPGGEWAMGANFSSRVFFGPVGQPIMAFQFTNAKLGSVAVAKTSNSFAYPGTTPSISSNGNLNPIVWAAENTSTAVLHAYDAKNLHELYNSNQASGGRDHFGTGNKFITPMITNGKVYVGTTNGVGVFGLLSAK
jgi:hypothetical protein